MYYLIMPKPFKQPNHIPDTLQIIGINGHVDIIDMIMAVTQPRFPLPQHTLRLLRRINPAARR
jgi:hypothetical protein